MLLRASTSLYVLLYTYTACVYALTCASTCFHSLISRLCNATRLPTQLANYIQHQFFLVSIHHENLGTLAPQFKYILFFRTAMQDSQCFRHSNFSLKCAPSILPDYVVIPLRVLQLQFSSRSLPCAVLHLSSSTKTHTSELSIHPLCVLQQLKAAHDSSH